MDLDLIRYDFTPTRTIGKLAIDGIFECYTLEDVVRIDDPTTVADEGGKVVGKTAIPAGRYKVDITLSNRFKRELPILLDVPNFTGIRIHPGNTDADTDGCILVGMNRSQDGIGLSRLAFNNLFERLQDAIADGEEIWIAINSGAQEREYA